jgi:cation:H+ antiporter
MYEDILTLLGSMVLVFIAAFLFVNAIEFIGCRFKWGGSFVSATLAPLFTSLPEMIIFLVALFGLGGASGEDIGIGTIFGQPFMASSLSYGLVGVAVFLGYKFRRRKTAVLAVSRRLLLPYIFITVLFPMTLIPAVVGGDLIRYIFGAIFLGAYIVYVTLMYRERGAERLQGTESPYICKVIRYKLLGGVIQLTAAVILLYFSSRIMVTAVAGIAEGLGISALALALVLIPAVTAIPETSSDIIWGWRGKDNLCLGALVGEKVLYSTFYPGIGMLLTSWVLDVYAYYSVLVCFVVSVVLMFFVAKQRLPWYWLLIGIGFFVAYAIFIFAPTFW